MKSYNVLPWLMSNVLSRRYLVDIDNNLMTTYDTLNVFGNVIDTITIGDLNIAVMEIDGDPIGLYANDFVNNIEFDTTVTIDKNYQHVLTGKYSSSDEKSYYLQDNPPWNLDRIDQRHSELDGRYFYPTSGGSEVNVFVVDTGIDVKHKDFKGRALWGGNFADNVNTDCNSHGTHVAGTIGSESYGVSKSTRLIAVKVLSCDGSGSMSGVLKGLEYVINQSKKATKPCLVNMSLGGGRSESLNRGIRQLTSNNIHVIVAAGNENQDACNTSPASEDTAMTVGATTRANKLAGFSNWGKCVDILAPGTEILSTVPGDKTAVLQGTSMASPAVAGVYALLLSENPTFTPHTMKGVMAKTCTKNAIQDLRSDTHNCLVYSMN